MSIPTRPLITLSPQEFLTDSEYADSSFVGNLPPDHTAYHIRLRDSSLEKADLSGARLLKSDCARLELTGTSLVGTSLSESSLSQVNFTKCRLTGAIFSEGQLEDCTIQDCAVNMAVFRFTSLKNVRFIGCNLQGADFLEATLRKVTFENCNLEGTNFSHVKINQVDLSGSQLTDIRGIAHLRGATISSQQLIYLSHALAAELGITVAD